MAIDYNEASKTYDNTRDSSAELIGMFNARLHFTESMNVLDFGCGTGNYLHAIHQKYKPHCFGVEPSDGMIEKALAKNPGLSIRKGDHSNIPFEDDFFDFIFMTDVIHHVPDLDTLFRTLYRKLKMKGKVCIVTESHGQIDSRWYNAYFSSLAGNEKQRYPDISEIVAYARKNSLRLDENHIRRRDGDVVVTDQFIKMVEEKNYSMFRLLEEAEYRQGLAKLRQDRGQTVKSGDHAETLIWLRK